MAILILRTVKPPRFSNTNLDYQTSKGSESLEGFLIITTIKKFNKSVTIKSATWPAVFSTT